MREAFATALDFLRACMDVSDVAPRSEPLGYGDTIEQILAPLRERSFVIAVATRTTRIAGEGWK